MLFEIVSQSYETYVLCCSGFYGVINLIFFSSIEKLLRLWNIISTSWHLKKRGTKFHKNAFLKIVSGGLYVDSFQNLSISQELSADVMQLLRLKSYNFFKHIHSNILLMVYATYIPMYFIQQCLFSHLYQMRRKVESLILDTY